MKLAKQLLLLLLYAFPLRVLLSPFSLFMDD
jgi:hypothetical protein